MTCVVDLACLLMTGLPIDYEVLSNFCIRCQVRNDNLPTQAEYDEWREKHSPNCPKSFNIIANAVKVECALSGKGLLKITRIVIPVCCVMVIANLLMSFMKQRFLGKSKSPKRIVLITSLSVLAQLSEGYL